MLIKIENLGPIYKFDIDLEKDLHLLYGENAIGKSYAVGVIYCLLDSLKPNSEDLYYFLLAVIKNNKGEESLKKYAEFINLIPKILFGGEKFDFTEDVRELLNLLLTDFVLNKLEDSLENTFGSLKHLGNKISNKHFRITVDFVVLSFSIVFDETNECLKVEEILIKEIFIFGVSQKIKETIFSFTSQLSPSVLKGLDGIEKLSDSINFSDENTSEENDSTEKDATDNNSVNDRHWEILFTELKKLNSFIYLLPASRSGLFVAMDSFGALMSELSQFRNKLKKSIKLPTLSKPVADYFLHLSDFYAEIENKSLCEIAQEMEKELLQGEILKEEDGFYYKSYKTNDPLPLEFASSMICEIAPMVVFLKYVLREPSPSSFQVLFIEEPEAHLHPRLQVKLMEFFVKLSQKGIKVIITSHSNYMFDKLGNTILSGFTQPEKIGIYHLEMSENGSIVKNDMNPDKDGMDDYNFSQVSEELYNERMALYEQRRNKKS